MTELVDDLLGRTVQLNDDRTRLYEQISPYITNNLTGGSAESLTGVLSDLKTSFELQSELLQIYEEINPTADQIVPSSPPTSISPHIVDSDLDKTVDLETPLLSETVLDDEIVNRGPKIVRRTSMFAFYSLALWFLGILTSLVVTEYLSTSDWALESLSDSKLIF